MSSSRAPLWLLTTASLLASAQAQSGNLIGLSANGKHLVTFDAGTPGTIAGMAAIGGIGASDFIVSIDFRPSTGELYGVARSSRVYTIDASTGQATQVGSSTFTPALFGRVCGIDFNPVPDRIRVVSNAEQNLRLHPDTGAVAAVDTDLAFAPGDPNAIWNPFVAGVAYTNNYAGSTSTTLYAIDSRRDALLTIGGVRGAPSPNGGQLFTVGNLGVDVTGFAGFDISPFGGAIASLNNPADASTRIYQINLSSGAATLLGTVGGGMMLRDIAIVPPSSPAIYAVTSDNTLISFAPGRPGVLTKSVGITGLGSLESVVGIDFRPANGGLYALTSTSRVLVVDVNTGAGVQVGSMPFSPPVTGSAFGFDFNPTVDRIRVVGNTEENLRLHPITGALAATDMPIAYAMGDPGFGVDPSLVGSAYTNNFAGSTSTTLYGIDAARDVLVSQGSIGSSPVSPNSGQLFTVGALGFDTSDSTGFDISSFGGAFASLTGPGTAISQLYVVNLASGVSTLVGTIGGGQLVRALAIAQPDVERAYGVTPSNELISFHLGDPGVLLSNVSITGMAPAETVVGIDFRPATGRLFALSNASQVYTVDRTSGVASFVGGPLSSPLSGSEFGFDFNPAVDRIRVISDSGQNLRLDPNTGALAATDAPLAFDASDANFGASPNCVAAGYNRSFAAGFGTTLFAIDSSLNALVRQGSAGGSPTSPNAGTLFTIGGLGLDVSDAAGFDVTALGGAFASLTPSNATGSSLYSINLTTGAATAIGAIGNAPKQLRCFAVLPAGL